MSRKRRKVMTIEHAGMTIREYRPGYYMVDFWTGSRKHGDRHRKCFRNLDEAKLHCERKATELKNHGLAALTLSDEQRRDAVKALEVLDGSASLLQAAHEYIRLHPQRNAELLRWTCWRYLRQLCREGARPITVKNARWKLRLWCQSAGDRVTASILPSEIDSWVKTRGYKGHSAKGYTRQLNAVVNFFHGKRAKRDQADETPPAIFPIDAIKRLFAKAEETEKVNPGMVAPLALMFFAGIRPHEIHRLSWEQINLADREITVTAEASKVRSSRVVKLEPNLSKWLVSYRGTGNISPGIHEFRRRREELMEKAKIESWPVDVARHTFASALYAVKNDAAYVASQLGHFGSLSIFARHYKSLMKTSDAEKFWTIQPHTKGKVIELKATA